MTKQSEERYIPSAGNLKVKTKNYLFVIDVYQYVKKFNKQTKKEVIDYFKKHKSVVSQVWECYHELDLTDNPYKIYERIYPEL
jgi:hypothetical protein